MYLKPLYQGGVTDTVMVEGRNTDLAFWVILCGHVGQLIGISGLEKC